MPRLSRLLCFAGLLAIGLGAWSIVTFPIIKFSTESIVRGRLHELIDRSQLTEDEIESLDQSMAFILSNDRHRRESQQTLHKIAVGGFAFCAVCLFSGALLARRLEIELTTAKSE